MIRKATYADIPQMRFLWEQCFDDPLNYVDFIYDNHIILPEQTYVIEDNLKIVSMATALAGWHSGSQRNEGRWTRRWSMCRPGGERH